VQRGVAECVAECVAEPIFKNQRGGGLQAPRNDMGWLRLVGSLKLQVYFAKEPYKRDDILPKRPIILRSLLSIATP